MINTLYRSVKSNRGLVCLFVALGGSLTLNVLMGRELQRQTVAGESRMAGIREGTSLPSIEALDLDGRAVSVVFASEKPTVLYVLSPTCVWCQRNEKNIIELARKSATRYRFIGLSTGGDLKELNEYLKRSPLPFDVFFVESAQAATELELGVTPQTAVIDRNGKVEHSWQGAYDGPTAQEIEAMFGVALPGLRPVSTSAERR